MHLHTCIPMCASEPDPMCWQVYFMYTPLLGRQYACARSARCILVSAIFPLWPPWEGNLAESRLVESRRRLCELGGLLGLSPLPERRPLLLAGL